MKKEDKKIKETEKILETANQEIKEWQKFRDLCLRRLKRLKMRKGKEVFNYDPQI
mgnify:FL=1